MSEEELPLWRGLARRSDPETSKLAAEGVVLDGTVQRSKALALNAVRDHPGQTARELAERIGVRSIHRRLTELDRDGVVSRCESRRCAITGRKAATWRPVDNSVKPIKPEAQSEDRPYSL